MRSIKRSSVLVLLAFAAVPLFAANADLVSVSTHVSSATASQGGANQGEIVINNITTADVRVRLDARVVYADGTVQRLSGLGDPGTLPPGGGYVLNVYFVIPPDAALGNATFIADVAAASGGLQENERSSASFLVVP